MAGTTGYKPLGYNNDMYDGFDLSKVSPQASGVNAGNTTDQFGIPKDQGFSLGDYTKLGTGVANAYLGYQGLKLGEKQFDFAKNSFNTNLANQAQLINNQMETQARDRLSFSGNYDQKTDEGNASLQADLQSYLKPRQVSGKAI